MFLSGTGVAINSDVNGAIGIALKSKVADESFVKEIISTGQGCCPFKIGIN